MPNGRACLQPVAVPYSYKSFHHPAPRGGGGASRVAGGFIEENLETILQGEN